MKNVFKMLLLPFTCKHCDKINKRFLVIFLATCLILSYGIGYWRHAYYDEWNVATFYYHKNNPVMSDFNPVDLITDYFRKKAQKPEVTVEDMRTGKVEKH